MAGFAVEAAKMAGVEELNPAPVHMEQYELVVNGCEGVGRLLVSILEPVYGRGEPLNILLYGTGLRETLGLARSLTVAYSLADGLGCSPAKPRIVVFDHEPPRGSEPLIARLVGAARWIAVYRLSRLGMSLGDQHTVGDMEGVVLDCEGCGRPWCRVLASLLDAAGVLQGVRVDSLCASPRAFVDSGLTIESKCRSGLRSVKCTVIDGEYLMLRECRYFYTLVFRLLGVGDECLRDLVRFEARTGLDDCKAGFIVGFKRMADFILNRRVW